MAEDTDWAARAITNAETPEQFRWALQVIRVDEDLALDGFETGDSHGGFVRYRPLMQEMMLRMRDAHPDYPSVPTGDDSVDYVNWCIDAENRDRELAHRGQADLNPVQADLAAVKAATPIVLAGSIIPGTKPVWSFAWRTALAAGTLTALWVAIGFAASYWTEGTNLFQKMTNAWCWFAAAFGGVAIGYRFLLGRDLRRKFLEWVGAKSSEAT